MSEFFKALEQAERDRLRQDPAQAAAAPPAPPEAESANPEQKAAAGAVVVAKPGASRPVAAPEPATTARPAVSKPRAAEAAAAARPAAPKPAAPEPVVARASAPEADTAEPVATPVATPKRAADPAAVSTPPGVPQAPSPASMFRPSLRTRGRSRGFGREAKREPLLIALTNPNSIEADAYRTVRANIELMSNGRPTRLVAITSAAGGDGKSTTAANLAIVAAQAGRRVCLVDADLRHPTVHEIFGLPNVDGLVVALEQGKTLQAVARSTDIENLSVVVAGRGADETFQEVLTAQRLEKVLRDSEAAFDLVLFDSPPVASVADALSVTAVCDGVLLVVRSGSIPFGALRRAVAQIKQVKGRVLGVLLNQVDLRTIGSDSYRYRAYHAKRASS